MTQLLLCLTNEEIQNLTGYIRSKEQTRWLRERGYPHEIGGDGVPKVLRSYVIHRLGGNQEAQKTRPKIRLSSITPG